MASVIPKETLHLLACTGGDASSKMAPVVTYHLGIILKTKEVCILCLNYSTPMQNRAN